MPTLLIRLAGPMQAWGTQSRFDLRDTGFEPSKSAVVGLLAAALGWERSHPLQQLPELRMGVLVLREGLMSRDYHTVLDVPKASGAAPGTVVSQRYFLADADFLVALQHADRNLLERLNDALQRPHWPVYLGRRAMPPTEPLHVPDGLLESDDIASALADAPLHQPVPDSSGDVADDNRPPDWYEAAGDLDTQLSRRLVIEIPPAEVKDHPGHSIQRRMDQPISFMPPKHGVRYVKISQLERTAIGGAS